MSVSNFKNIEMNYIYMECPKREYYFVSNLTFSHECEYIKPIGEFLVEFLNADLEGYDELLKRLYDIVFETETPDPIYPAIPFIEFMEFYEKKLGFIFTNYVVRPVFTSIETLGYEYEKNPHIHVPKKVYREWYRYLKDYLVLHKRYKKFIDYIFNIKRNRFDSINKAILKANDDFPDISRTNLSRFLTSAPIKNGKFDLEYIEKINTLDEDIMEKSRMVYEKSSEFKPLYAIQIHSLNEALFYEFSELVKNGYRIKKCGMCGKYFLMITKRDVLYCKNINESGFSCAQLASKEKYKESLNDPFLKEYAKISEKMYQRYYRVNDVWYDEELSGKDMTFDEYYDWSREAQELRREYVDARDAISKNSNLSSKQKFSRKKKLGEKFITDINAIPYPDKPGKRKSKGIIME